MASRTIRVKVHAKRVEAEGVISLDLRPVLDATLLPPFTAGAHIDLRLPVGPRSYSLTNSPGERHRYVVAVGLSSLGSGGSSFVHRELERDMQLEISLPRNAFELDAQARSSILIAGGIGITPILCMYNELKRQGRPVKLLYCARSRTHAAFLQQLKGCPDVRLHFDDEHGSPVDLFGYMSSHANDAAFYCCGPAPMLAAYKEAAQRLEVPAARVHFEHFAASSDAVRARIAQTRHAFKVVLSRSGVTLDINGSDSILDAVIAAGVDVDFSCREGNCGACETVVIDGEPEHRDAVLTEAERQSGKLIMICVSGCKGERIVLDL